VAFRLQPMERGEAFSKTWRTTHGDLTDEEWELIGDLVAPTPERTDRPPDPKRPSGDRERHLLRRRDGCQWRACPPATRTGTPSTATTSPGAATAPGSASATACAASCASKRAASPNPPRASSTPEASVAQRRSPPRAEDTTPERRSRGARPSASSIPLGCSSAWWSSSRRRATTPAHRGDRPGAREVRPLAKVFCDGGFKRAFVAHCGGFHISAEVVRKIASGTFEVLPRRWVVERTWSWLMNHRRLQVDYERDPLVAEGFIWAAHARLLLRRLTEPPSMQRAA